MKRGAALLIACILIVSMCACGDENSTMQSTTQSTINGIYSIESVVYEGYYLSPDDSMSASYVSVTQSGKNLLATVYLSFEDEYGMLTGHLSEYLSDDESIQYKFWIDSTVGDLIDSTDWIYLYYNSDSDSIDINVSDDMGFQFAK